MNAQLLEDLRSFYPEIALTATLLVVVLVDLAAGRARKGATIA